MADPAYRSTARQALARAKSEIASDEPERLKYAALELRMAIEALVYDRLQIFKDELTTADYDTWQPKKIMTMMLDIDPWADQPRTLIMGLEEQPGVAAKNMTMLGTENVLSMVTIKKNYDALGSILHLPTVKQYESGWEVDLKAWRERLGNIVSAIEVVLASNLSNASLTIIVELDCRRCGERIRKRAPAGNDSRYVPCLKCGAEYRLTGRDDNKVVIASVVHKMSCANESCAAPMELWRDEFKDGHKWKCVKCGQQYEVGLEIVKVATQEQTD